MLSKFAIMLIAGLSGGGLFILVYRYMTVGANIYEQQFVGQVGVALRDSFVFYDTRRLFVMTLVAMAIVGAVVLLLFGFLAAIIAIALVAVLPWIAVKMIKKNRTKKFVYQMPDCLSAIASSLRAGTNLSRAMEQAAIEQPTPISQEFALVLSEHKMGRKIEDSFQAMYRRINTPEVALMNSAIAISRSVGGNLADTLDTLASTLREKAQVEGKIDAQTSMGKMQGWIMAILPLPVAFMIYKNEPDAMRAFIDDPVGWAALGIIGFLLVLAIYTISKIVNIDV